jgi:ERCC4 domain
MCPKFSRNCVTIMKLTDKQISDIIKDMIVLVDTREQKNDHILSFMDSEKIQYRIEKLETADYTFVLPNYTELGLDQKFLVEKKNSLDEISGNFGKDRERFKREFERVCDQKIHMVIENATWKKVKHHNYRSLITPKSFTASLLTWCIRYKCPVWFVGKDESAELIINLLHYELMEALKKMRD